MISNYYSEKELGNKNWEVVAPNYDDDFLSVDEKSEKRENGTESSGTMMQKKERGNHTTGRFMF